jgi:hypothetical protein
MTPSKILRLSRSLPSGIAAVVSLISLLGGIGGHVVGHNDPPKIPSDPGCLTRVFTSISGTGTFVVDVGGKPAAGR